MKLSVRIRNLVDKYLYYLMVLPSFLFVVPVIAFPLLYSFYLSFTSYTLLEPQATRWIGLANYVELLQDPTFWRVMGNTILLLVVVTNIEFLLGLAVASLLNRDFRGQNVVGTLFMLPMMFAPVVVGIEFRFLYNDVFGLVNNVLIATGLIHHGLGWLIEPGLALLSVIITEVWENTSFMIVVLYAGLRAIPREPFEAADLDGASAWQKFRHLTLPMLKPLILIAFTIRSLDVVRIFDIIQIMTGGGPANRTEVMGTYIYRLAVLDARFGYGNAMAYVSIILTLAFALYLFRQIQKTRR